MYSLPPEVIYGTKLINALQDLPFMPSINQVRDELLYVQQCIEETERFYGVPFRNSDNENKEFEAVDDVQNHLYEFYFNGNQERDFGFRINPMYKLLVEPLLDSFRVLTHDQLLNCINNVIEQLTEYLYIASVTSKISHNDAYSQYKKIVDERQEKKKITTIVQGILDYRSKCTV